MTGIFEDSLCTDSVSTVCAHLISCKSGLFCSPMKRARRRKKKEVKKEESEEKAVKEGALNDSEEGEGEKK